MRLLVVDGYNVIRSCEPYRQMAERTDLDTARTLLLSDVAAYAAGEWDAVVVFDGGGNPHSDGAPSEMCGVRVVFSPFGMPADGVVERLVHEARTKGTPVEVVSSDAQIQWAVMGQGVVRRSAGEFSSHLDEGRQDIAEHRSTGKGRVRIEDLIDPDTKAALRRMSHD